MLQDKSLLKDFAKYVSQNVLGMVGMSCYILADTFFIADCLGADGLTALNLAIPAYGLMVGLGLMLGMGAATRYTIAGGGTRKNPQTGIFSQAMYYFAGISMLFLAVAIFFMDPLVRVLGADAGVYEVTHCYLQTVLLFAPCFLLNNIMLCFIRNDGNPRLAMIGMLLASLSNVVLDYVFMYPLQMGIFGAAFATGLAPLLSLLVLSRHILKKQHGFAFRWHRPSLKQFADISALGASALVTELSSGVVILVINKIILSLSGNIGVAAYGVIANLALVVVSIFNGISQGIQPLLSRAYANDRLDQAKNVFHLALVTALAVAALVYAVTFFFAEGLVQVFNSEGNAMLAQIAEPGLRIYFLGFFFVGINIIAASYFSALSQPKYGFLISTLRGFAVPVPVVFLLSSWLGLFGVWAAYPCGELLVFGLTVYLCVRAAKMPAARPRLAAKAVKGRPALAKK